MSDARVKALVMVGAVGLVLVALGACAPRTTRVPTTTGAFAPAPREPDGSAYRPQVMRLLELVNIERAHGAACGAQLMPPVPPLTLEPRLVRAAQLHSDDQAAHFAMGHGGSDGSSPGVRATRAGYVWSLVAENVAWNQPTPEVVMQAWMDSPGHCENIMRDGVVELGAGETDLFWTLVFAAPL
ncbi:MAG: CAP domain-containing protein [Trueperaceae bacterium]|nr:CAP domain-containing protein [Trueperaceae bacterium]MCO5175255.1 CAP domain-containing protein [Trueperaceae bacterium]MCW5819654.1 CAP domain-containing protein [Trueperaceae bacterium]